MWMYTRLELIKIILQKTCGRLNEVIGWTHALRGSYEFGSVRPYVRRYVSPFFITAFVSGLLAH